MSKLVCHGKAVALAALNQEIHGSLKVGDASVSFERQILVVGVSTLTMQICSCVRSAGVSAKHALATGSAPCGLIASSVVGSLSSRIDVSARG